MSRDLAGAAAKLRTARALAKKHQAQEEANFAAYRAVLAGAAIDPSRRADALRAFDLAVAAAKPSHDRVFNLEDSIFAELQAMDRDLAHPKGPWTFNGTGITFSSRYDLEDYDAHVRKVNALNAEAMRVQSDQ